MGASQKGKGVQERTCEAWDNTRLLCDAEHAWDWQILNWIRTSAPLSWRISSSYRYMWIRKVNSVNDQKMLRYTLHYLQM